MLTYHFLFVILRVASEFGGCILWKRRSTYTKKAKLSVVKWNGLVYQSIVVFWKNKSNRHRRTMNLGIRWASKDETVVSAMMHETAFVWYLQLYRQGQEVSPIVVSSGISGINKEKVFTSLGSAWMHVHVVTAFFQNVTFNSSKQLHKRSFIFKLSGLTLIRKGAM